MVREWVKGKSMWGLRKEVGVGSGREIRLVKFWKWEGKRRGSMWYIREVLMVV